MNKRTDTEKCLDAIAKMDPSWYLKLLEVLAHDYPNILQNALAKVVDQNIEELKKKYPGYPECTPENPDGGS